MTETVNRFSRACARARMEPLSLNEAVGLARRLRARAAGESEEGRVALGWALINARGGQGPCGGAGCGDFPDADFWRAMATICRIMSGDVADPTQGATRFHAHDTWPDWAREAAPKALIGRHFFYESVSSVPARDEALGNRQ